MLQRDVRALVAAFADAQLNLHDDWRDAVTDMVAAAVSMVPAGLALLISHAFRTPDTIDEAGFPTGGHGLVVLNAEARIPLRGGLGAVAFVDGGNVWRNVSEMDFAQMRGAVGFGLRYRSPVGPIRIDLGFKLDREMLPTGQRERPTALHISLGQAF